MTMLVKTLAAVAAGTVLASIALAQSAREIRGVSPYVAIDGALFQFAFSSLCRAARAL